MPVTQSSASLQYLRVQVVATVNGVNPYNPTGDAVQFGFLPLTGNRADTVPGSWVAGSWEIDTIAGQTAYVARCLVGPGGTFQPTAQTTYWTWIKLTDNPEIPVLQVGQLTIH